MKIQSRNMTILSSVVVVLVGSAGALLFAGGSSTTTGLTLAASSSTDKPDTEQRPLPDDVLAAEKQKAYGPLSDDVAPAATLFSRERIVGKARALVPDGRSIDAVMMRGDQASEIVGARSADINDNRPVWVVTVHGQTAPWGGPQAGGDRLVDSTTIVFDALTGEVTDQCWC
jgi:uncharacterized iron-regulated membrane protein